jgi:hypothetical protein
MDHSLTREFVTGVLQHLVESRVEFFEHLRLQSQMINELALQVREVQRPAVSEELRRLEAMDREIAEIRRQLDRLLIVSATRAPAAGEAVHEPRADLIASPPELPGDSADEISSIRPVRPGGLRSPADFEAAARVDGPLGPADGEELSADAVRDAHAFLSARMSRLSRERKSRWSDLFQKLGFSQ